MVVSVVVKENQDKIIRAIQYEEIVLIEGAPISIHRDDNAIDVAFEKKS